MCYSFTPRLSCYLSDAANDPFSPVKSVTAAYPGKIIMKMGMFPRIPQPEAQGFGQHRQSWEGKHDGIPVFEFKWMGPEKKQMAE